MKNKALTILMVLIIIVIIILLLPNFIELINFKCIYKEVLHIYCAGCGGTRMLKALLAGNIYQAFRYNPYLFSLSIFLFIFAIIDLSNYVKNKKILFYNTKLVYIVAISAIVFMILRNIPYFSFLLPTKI